jgi:hypothetical protein
VPKCSLPNVPLLSCGRIRKPRAREWRRASPWYSTTGEGYDAEARHEARPSASTACWPARRRSRELAAAFSFWRVTRLGSCGQHGSHRERARIEPAPRGVGLAPSRPEARSLGGPANVGRPGLLALPNTEARNTQRATTPRPVARPSPWYFTTGERTKLDSRMPVSLCTRAGRNPAVSFSRPVAHRRVDAPRRQGGRCAAHASPETPANHSPASKPDLVELNRCR